MGASSGLVIAADGGGCVFYVHVVPRSRRDEVVGLYAGAMRVRLTAPPVDGKVNDALCIFLARALQSSRGDVTILGGHASRHKRVQVVGVSPAEIRTLLPK